MQNIKLKKQELLSLGHTGLDLKLGGGLRPGRVTELVGPSDLTHAVVESCIEAARNGGRSVGIIDYVHDLKLPAGFLSEIPIAQPGRVSDLSQYVGKMAVLGLDLIILFLGDEISFHDGRARSPVEWEADLCLKQIRWSLASAATACLVVTNWPVMPDGPTVIKMQPDGSVPGGARADVTTSLEQEFRFLS
jgi:hypothetical protein